MCMLSICVTTYNLEKYIGETLKSIFEQQIDYSFEVLIGDDGSYDATLSVIAEWEAKYSDIIRHFVMDREVDKKYNFIYRASYNRLNLLKHARGKYITFLDGDDLYKDKLFLKRAIAFLENPENQDCFICAGRTDMLFEDGRIVPLLMNGKWKIGKLSSEEYWQELYTHAEAAVMRNDLDIDSRYRGYFDDNLIIYYGLKKGKIYLLESPVINYRQYENSGFFKRPVVERLLYSLIDLDVEKNINPELYMSSLKRHYQEIDELDKVHDQITIERYPEIYKQAKETDATVVLSIFQENLSQSLQNSRRTLFNRLTQRYPYYAAKQNRQECKKRNSLTNTKIHVVFLCYRPAIWISMSSIYEACMSDADIEVTIVAIPIRQQGIQSWHGKEVYVSEGAEEFFSSFKCRVINGYDYDKMTWLDLKSLMPDYIFYSQPYNIHYQPGYHSYNTRNYARLCWVPYCTQVIGGEVEESVYPRDFMNDLSFLFLDIPSRKKWCEHRVIRGSMLKKENIRYLGYPRFDNMDKYIGCESKSWKQPRSSERMRILWTPRWATEEGNCNFFAYKNKIIEFAEHNMASVEIVFRPHPQMWKNFAFTGEMNEQEQKIYRSKINSLPNMGEDSEQEYLPTFYSSDVLVTDVSSIIAEYMCTGLPVIYCHKDIDNFSAYGFRLLPGCYVANNWNEVVFILQELRRGKDPLCQKRRDIIQAEHFAGENQNAGINIKECIKKDYYANNIG